MGGLISSKSSDSSDYDDSMPQVYDHITFLVADSNKDFPREFDPERPVEVWRYAKLSRKGFVWTVDRLEGSGVMPLEDFDDRRKAAPVVILDTAEDAHLYDGAVYVVVPRTRRWRGVSPFCHLYFVIIFQ